MSVPYFFIFDPNTGEILRSISCDPATAELQTLPGESIIIAAPGTQNNEYYIDLNTLTQVPFPEQPSTYHQFNYTTHQWFDPRTDGQLRDAKWEEVKVWRETALNSPLTWNSYVFDADVKGQTNLKGAAQLAQFALVAEQPFTTTFTLANNTDVTLTAMETLMVGVALGVRTEECYARGRELRELIYDPVTSIEDLEGLQWESS